jgi:signal transduction histidine kinase
MMLPDIGQQSHQGERAGMARPAKAQVMAAIQELAQILASDLEPEIVLPAALQALINIMAVAQTGAVFLHQPGPGTLSAECVVGYESDSIQHMSLRANQGMVGQVFQSGKARLFKTPDQVGLANVGMTSENRKRLARAMHGSALPQSAICVPLLLADATGGVLVLETWQQRTFSERDLRLAEALAGLIAMYLDRKRLVGEANQCRGVMHNVGQLQQDIMASLSHEMRTPLASIKGYASALLLEEVTWKPQVQRDYLGIIVDEADKLGEIVTDLLDASVIDSGRLKIEKEPTLLARLARQVVDEIELRTQSHRFLVSFPSDFPVVDADAGRIRRVLYNLLDNAVKYSPDGGLIVVRGEVSDNEVTISVADQGHGIAPEHLNRLFERFFRVKFASGRHVVGSGLGLPIARNIVEAHGGRIWAESKLGEGTTVSFTLSRGGLSDAVRIEGE